MSQKAHENSLRSTCSELWRKWRRGKSDTVRHLCRSFRVFCSWRLPRHVQSSCCRWMEPWPWPSFCVHQTKGISSENRQTTIIDLFFQLSSCELSTFQHFNFVFLSPTQHRDQYFEAGASGSGTGKMCAMMCDVINEPIHGVGGRRPEINSEETLRLKAGTIRTNESDGKEGGRKG